MIVSKLSRSRHLVCCNHLFQKLVKNDPSKVGLWFFMDRMFISSSNQLSRSTVSLSQLNLGLSPTGTPNGTSSLITDEHWPNLLFTDDTWSDVDDNGDERLNRLANTAWDSSGSEDVSIRNYSTCKLLFTPKYRESLVKVISEELDLNHRQADGYLNFLRIKPIKKKYDEMRFIRERRNLLRLLKKHLTRNDIIDSFELFTLSLRVAQYRISFLKECGFKSLKSCHLLNFDKIQTLSAATVKHLKLLDSNVCVVDSLLLHLPNLTDNESSHLRESLTIQGLTLGQLYERAISFSLRKLANSGEIWKSKNRKRYLSIKGISILSNALTDYSLMDSYSSSDLLTLFQVDPNNLEEIITEIPKDFDENTLLILLKYPKILQTHSPTLLENLNLLKYTFGFTNDEIDNYPDCLMIETNEIKERINNLYSIFGSSDARSILSLIHLDMAEISSLLKEMKDNGFPVTDVSSVYEYHKMTSEKIQLPAGVIPAHLRGLNRELNVPQSIIVQTLHRHPNFRLSDNHKIKKTYQYIQSLEGITKEQLMNGLNLCLYDIEKIKEAFNTMKERDDFEEWRKHPYFLEALIYTIEKTYSYDDVLIIDDLESITDDHES